MELFLIKFLIIAISCVLLIVIPFLLFLGFFRFKFRKSFNSLPDNLTRNYHKSNLLKTIFYDTPRAYMRDLSTRNPNEFPLYGLHFIVGEQGCGKTITMNYLIRKYKYEYPLLKIKTNFECSAVKDRIHSFNDIDSKGNGVYGELDCISELQTWFDCLQSKNFPTSALATVTQQRHVHRAILADTQNFTRCAKQLREQTFSVFEPHTFLGCFTLIRHYKPDLDDDGHIIRKRHIEWLWFVHDDELRNMYDSYSDVDYGQTILSEMPQLIGNQITEEASSGAGVKPQICLPTRKSFGRSK